MGKLVVVGSTCTGHGEAGPTTTEMGDETFQANGKAAHLTGFAWLPHGGKNKHVGHGVGSMPFVINGKKACFTGDKLDCSSVMDSGVDPFSCNRGYVRDAFEPTPRNDYLFGDDDVEWSIERVEYAVNQGYFTPEEYEKPALGGGGGGGDGGDGGDGEPTEPPETDETPPEEVDPVITECGLEVDPANIDYNMQLTPRVKLKDVSSNAVVSKYRIRAQNGLSEIEIICNLKNVAENVIERVKDKWPNVMVTSAFRAGSGRSQHLRGQAIDMQFPGQPKSFYFGVAQWMKDNLPYDQLLLEYKSTGTRLPWIHVSLTRGSNRRQVMTFWNHRPHGQGLVDLSSR